MIYTLYSFKGGVGRSMALANLAECFYERGLRVLMIDWDLEAPGLENYFYGSDNTEVDQTKELNAATAHAGLVDLLLDYRKAYPKIAAQAPMPRSPQPLEFEKAFEPPAPSQDTSEPDPEVALQVETAADSTRKFLEEMRLAQAAEPPNQEPAEAASPAALQQNSYADLVEKELPPLENYVQTVHSKGLNRLMLISAGARTPETFSQYAEAVQEFDWLEFLAVFDGREFLEWLRDRFAEIADVVLIDSRTGVTEMGGVCTRQMADAVIALCAPNSQNLNGIVSIASSFQSDSARKARFDRELQLLIVPTRIDDTESKLQGDYEKNFSRMVETETFIPVALRATWKPFWNLNVPYIPAFNYRERRVIGGDVILEDNPSRKLEKSYRTIALHMAALAPRDGALRSAFASDLASAYPELNDERVPQMAPLPPLRCIPRPEYGRLHSAVLTAERSGNYDALWGFAGTGKTTLAALLCTHPEVRERFPDGILWLTFDRPWEQAEVEDWLRNQFSLAKLSSSSLARALRDRRFLLVLDDVVDAEHLVPFTTLMRSSETQNFGNGLVLTRDRKVATAVTATPITVPMFGIEQMYPVPEDSQDLNELTADPFVVALRRWPLGATLLQRMMERATSSDSATSQAWDDVLRLLHLHGLSAFEIPGESTNPAAASLGRTLGSLPPAERKLLVELARQPEGKAAAKDELRSPAFQRLSDLALVEGRETVRVHPLVRAWLGLEGDLPSETAVHQPADRRLAIDRGYALLKQGSTSLELLLSTAEEAKDLRSFSLARRLFQLAAKSPEASLQTPAQALKLIQRQALCTYKDDDLPVNERFDPALALLRKADLLNEKPSQETLGLAGGAQKARWRLSGLRLDLEDAYAFYQRGAEQELKGDFGYTRINAAFVLDVMASLEAKSQSAAAANLRNQARQLREEIIAVLPALPTDKDYSFLKEEWWYFATLAEACLGLGRHSDARFWLREGLALAPNGWELESTSRQFVQLLKAQGLEVSAASQEHQTLELLLGPSEATIRSLIAGKTGLALSGGGYRASLFHIGVLARLAEVDVLRHVEVLSCVSGGSIVGALYYLKVKTLLESKPDEQITAEDYILLVQEIEREFLAGVQANLRVRMLAAWKANLRTLFQRGYTRTLYLAELYERFFYRRKGERAPIWLPDLKIEPAGEKLDFQPRLDNWHRAAKAPILLLNATTLNTGHNWQFAVTWMGEPPSGTNGAIDSNDLLRRLYYDAAPPAYWDKKSGGNCGIRMGQAVAASACVPALFDPVRLDGLYPDRRVELVDGGVHDNQGTGGLLDQECMNLLVSDGSGQMNSRLTPNAEIPSVLTRANDILMARVREQEFRELKVLDRSSALNNFLYLHLKEGLDGLHVDWIGCEDPYQLPEGTENSRLTSYGIDKRVQEGLAGLRTDLDSFSDTEAYALMMSGYLMAEDKFKRLLSVLGNPPREQIAWTFLQMRSALAGSTKETREQEHLIRILKVGSSKAFKAWRLPDAMVRIAPQILLLLVMLLLLLHSLFQCRLSLAPLLETELQYGSLVFFRDHHWVMWLFGFAVLPILVLKRNRTFTVLGTGILMVSFGALLARLHLWIVDPAYLHAGRIPSSPSSTEPGGSAHILSWGKVSRNMLLLLVVAVAALFATDLIRASLAHLVFGRDAALAVHARDLARYPNPNAPNKYLAEESSALWTAALVQAELAGGATGQDDRNGALSGRAYAHLQLQEWQEALNDYGQMRNSLSSDPDLRGQAWAAREMGHYSQARYEYEDVLRRYPNDAATQADLKSLPQLSSVPMSHFVVNLEATKFFAPAGPHEFSLEAGILIERYQNEVINRYSPESTEKNGDCSRDLYLKIPIKPQKEEITVDRWGCPVIRLTWRPNGSEWVDLGPMFNGLPD